MKQFQISYENRDDFSGKLAGIREFCGLYTSSRVTFYITWTENSQSELTEVTEEIEKQFPEADYYGNEASGNIAMGEFSFGIQVTCYVFEAEDTKTELVWVEKGGKVSSLEDLWALCGSKKGLRAIEMIPSMSYVEALNIDGNVPAVSRDVLIFGGASVNYDNATYDAAIIAKGHPRTDEGMAVMLYYGSSLAFFSSSILGWKGLGRLMEVTDSTGKCIKEIDGSPAYSIYEKYLNLTMEDKDTLVFPLIVEEDGNQFIRTPQIIMQDKSMQMFADIPKGTKVRIAYGDKNTILAGIDSKAKEIADFCPQAIKAYSCAARRLFWGDEEVSKETMPLQEVAPVCGFYTGGEILRFGDKLRVLNQTLAITGIREGEGERKIQGESLSRTEDKSLISRLTYFTEKIVEEEKSQRILAEGLEKVLSSEYQVMYYIDILNGKATFLHGDEDAKNFASIFNTNSPETLFENFNRFYVDTAVVAEDREKLKSVMNIANIIKVLKDSNSVSINYRVRRNLVNPVYTEMRIFKAAELNGILTAVVITFKLTDEELRTALEVQAKLREDALIIGALSEDFGCVYYIEIAENKSNDISVMVRTSALLRRLIPDWDKATHFTDQIGLIHDRLVYEPDKKLFYEDTRRERIFERLNHANTYYTNSRFLIDGEVRYYQVQFSAVRDGETLQGIVAGLRSIDEQMKKEIETQKQLQAALDAAGVANESKSNFLFNMSHDIRTPMNAIKGFTAMAKKYSDDRDKVRDYLEKIDISSQQLLTLINQVLEMSRIESGKIEFDEQPVNIRERFNSMVTVIEAQAKAKGLDFKASLQDIVHNCVLADDSRMGQITLNVVGNAIKYTPEGGSIEFSLREIPARREGFASYIFTVSDTGIGMSSEFLKRLFEPFSRENTSTVSRIQGTGLGMSIVKNLVDLKGGNIEVASAPGKGTRFDITMDLMITRQESPVPTPERTGPVSFEGLRVLLVEDNEMNREIAKDLLEEYGFIVEDAEDGDVALEMCRRIAERGDYGYYDFILMDIQMPRMNGYDATRAIRSIPSPGGRRIPIIAMTANAFEEDRKNAIASGMDEHLAKPIEIQKLFDTLARFL